MIILNIVHYIITLILYIKYNERYYIDNIKKAFITLNRDI